MGMLEAAHTAKEIFIMQEQITFCLYNLYVVNAVNKVDTISDCCLYLSYKTK